MLVEQTWAFISNQWRLGKNWCPTRVKSLGSGVPAAESSGSIFGRFFLWQLSDWMHVREELAASKNFLDGLSVTIKAFSKLPKSQLNTMKEKTPPPGLYSSMFFKKNYCWFFLVIRTLDLSLHMPASSPRGYQATILFATKVTGTYRNSCLDLLGLWDNRVARLSQTSTESWENEKWDNYASRRLSHEIF